MRAALPWRSGLPHVATLAWGAIAVLCGVLVAWLPPATTAAIGIGIACAVVCVITPLAGLTLLVILAPLRTLIATESPLQLPLDIGQITFLLCLAFWGIQRIVQRQPLFAWCWSPVHTCVLLFAVASGLTAFSALSLTAWLIEWLKWVVILVVLTVVAQMGRGQQWQWVVFVLVVAGCANALIGLYAFFGGSGHEGLLILGRFFRAFGTFGQPNPFGGFLGLLTPLALSQAVGFALRAWFLWRAGQPATLPAAIALFYAAAALLLLAGIGASWSRGAWLALVVALAALAFALPRKNWQSLLFVLGSASMVALLWISGLLPEAVVNRISSSTAEFFAFDDVRGVDITAENYAVVERLAHWQAALNMAQTAPWLGVGLGNYETAYEAHRLLNWEVPLGHAHNYYLNILAEAGMIGFLAYLLMWFGILGLTWRARQHPDVLVHATAAGLFGTWAYLAVHSLLDNLYVNNVFIHLGTLLGVLAVLDWKTWRTQWESK